MRQHFNITIALFLTFVSTSLLADGNQLFEVKTATDAIEQTSRRILSNQTPAERKSVRLASQANRNALKAYQKCPAKSGRAGKALKQASHSLRRHHWALTELSTSSTEIDALVAFSDSTKTDITALRSTGSVCDNGTSRTQDELDYVQAAPFVSFAKGWGNRAFGAHGSFGD